MRAFRWAALASLALLLLAPAPALAWLDYLEQFSGPSMRWGWDIEGRLVCFARKETSESLRAKAMFEQTAAFQNAFGKAFTAEDVRRLADAWQAVVRAWNDAGVVLIGASSLNSIAPVAQSPPPMNPLIVDARVFLGNNNTAEAKAWLYQVTAAVSAREQADQPGNRNKLYGIVPGVGVIWSACNLREGERRRASIDLGMRFFGRDGDPKFANGQRIMFTTIEPAFSWHVFDSDKLDFVDFGVGAGYYWFSSEAFPSFGGYFLEPVRLDFHFPQNSIKCGKGLAAFGCLQFALVRYGLLVFPGGFETAKWAARADQPTRIARDWVNNVGFFVDLEAIAQWRKNRKKG